MSSPSAGPCRCSTGPLGFLNYPPEIMNKVYECLFVDNSHILVFLCSSDPRLRQIYLKRSINQLGHSTELQWPHLYNSRYYVDANGRSGQFLRVCKKICFDGSPVLYRNLRIAMRPSPGPDPCLLECFQSNSAYILAWAEIITLENDLPLANNIKGWSLYSLHHFGAPRLPHTISPTVGRCIVSVGGKAGKRGRNEKQKARAMSM